MKSIPVLILASLLFLTSCGQKQPGSPPTTASAPAPADAAAAETPAAPTAGATPSKSSKQPKPPPAAVTPENAALVGAVHPFMTSQLKIFITEKGRLPNDFREFANARMDSVPRLPPGLRYEVDKTTVEIKVVRDQ